MKETLTNKNIKSIELIDMLQEEIAKELEKKEREQKILYKRISVVFVSIFWVPFAFLTKYYIEQSSTELTLENYLLLSSSLLVLAMQFIGLVIAIGNQLEDFMSITKKDLLLTNRYLSDIKYLYIMEQEN
ncbi:hypothetical protein GIX45_15765 [Erwinia sp. CPCC 100877]|nr:hypothetical protein [Erwinia sp. CPCC 100877]